MNSRVLPVFHINTIYYLYKPICGQKAVGSFLFVWASIFGIFELETVFWLSAIQWRKTQHLEILNKIKTITNYKTIFIIPWIVDFNWYLINWIQIKTHSNIK